MVHLPVQEQHLSSLYGEVSRDNDDLGGLNQVPPNSWYMSPNDASAAVNDDLHHLRVALCQEEERRNDQMFVDMWIPPPQRPKLSTFSKGELCFMGSWMATKMDFGSSCLASILRGTAGLGPHEVDATFRHFGGLYGCFFEYK
jgi:hypothetical protein